MSTDLRADWDERGRIDALYHVDSTRERWTVEEFYARGRVIVAEIVDPVLRHLNVDPTNERVLEIGCGVGRLFEGLNARFAEVWGIDVSTEMVRRGRAECPAPARWIVGDGHSLTGVDDSSVDHVLSFEVFQHLPERAVIGSYLAETHRVLRPGGTFQLQLRSGNDSARQAVIRALPRRMRASIVRAAQAMGLTHVAGDIDTWIGCVVSPADAVALANDLTFQDVSALPDTMHRPGMGYWLVGRKAL